MSIAQRERAGLVEILRAVGPDAPTLCERWTTRDLTAHLVVRERRPDALPGTELLHIWCRAGAESMGLIADLVHKSQSGKAAKKEGPR